MLYISYIWVYIEHMFYILLLACIPLCSEKQFLIPYFLSQKFNFNKKIKELLALGIEAKTDV